VCSRVNQRHRAATFICAAIQLLAGRIHFSRLSAIFNEANHSNGKRKNSLLPEP
jgi:hypothetical protein